MQGEPKLRELAIRRKQVHRVSQVTGQEGSSSDRRQMCRLKQRLQDQADSTCLISLGTRKGVLR